MKYAYAKNGCGERALKNGKPILYPSSSKAAVPLEREQLKFSNGWCETAKFWVVDDKGMESIAFKSLPTWCKLIGYSPLITFVFTM